MANAEAAPVFSGGAAARGAGSRGAFHVLSLPHSPSPWLLPSLVCSSALALACTRHRSDTSPPALTHSPPSPLHAPSGSPRCWRTPSGCWQTSSTCDSSVLPPPSTATSATFARPSWTPTCPLALEVLPRAIPPLFASLLSFPFLLSRVRPLIGTATPSPFGRLLLRLLAHGGQLPGKPSLHGGSHQQDSGPHPGVCVLLLFSWATLFFFSCTKIPLLCVCIFASVCFFEGSTRVRLCVHE